MLLIVGLIKTSISFLKMQGLLQLSLSHKIYLQHDLCEIEVFFNFLENRTLFIFNQKTNIYEPSHQKTPQLLLI